MEAYRIEAARRPYRSLIMSGSHQGSATDSHRNISDRQQRGRFRERIRGLTDGSDKGFQTWLRGQSMLPMRDVCPSDNMSGMGL